MAKDKKCCEEGHMGMYHRNGWKMLLLGVLVLVNVYWVGMSWWTFLGWVLVLFGLIKTIKGAIYMKMNK